MVEWWGPLSAIIPSGTFIVLLIVLWKIMRSVDGLYISVTYMNDRLREMSEAVQQLAAQAEARQGTSGVAPVADDDRVRKPPRRKK